MSYFCGGGKRGMRTFAASRPSLLREISKAGIKAEGRYYDPKSANAATQPDMLVELQLYVTLVLAKSHKPKLASR